MRYLRRDPQGNVLGHYANPQSFTTEEVPDDHPDLLAFTAARQAREEASITISQLVTSLSDLQARVTELERKTATLP